MKGVQIITNFKRPIYQTYENDVKLLKFKRDPVWSICAMFEK